MNNLSMQENSRSLIEENVIIKICCKLNKEFRTDGVTLIIVTMPQFFDEQHFVNEAVEFPVALLENTKLVLIQKIFVTVQFYRKVHYLRREFRVKLHAKTAIPFGLSSSSIFLLTKIGCKVTAILLPRSRSCLRTVLAAI